jgi:hypothetical protein
MVIIAPVGDIDDNGENRKDPSIDDPEMVLSDFPPAAIPSLSLISVC